MEGIELHLFHGFLGQPSDWSDVIECLGEDGVCHDLASDMELLGDKISFSSWAELKDKELNQSQKKKILVGYSLGGRLAMHLSPDSYDRLILLGSHPGLLQGHELRLAQDFVWIEKFKDLPLPQWIGAWNSQPIFNDKTPRNQSLKSEKIRTQIKALDCFSLGRQEEKWHKISSLKNKIHWGCGEYDKKFIKMQEQLNKCLGSDYVFTVSGSGHRVHFDNPKGVAEKIKEVTKSV